jgi:hypothetical protein
MSPRLGALPIACALAGPVAAQSAPPPAVPAADPLPAILEACYVPASGTVYRINTTAAPALGAPKDCLSPVHVKFRWSVEGPKGDKGEKGEKGDKGDPGQPGSSATLPRNSWGGLKLDDQNGFASVGTLGVGNLLGVSGTGPRVIWYPRKGAFRAGYVHGTEWDEASIGLNSTALGISPIASGVGSVSIGNFTKASGPQSTALGYNASTETFTGAFVIGDASPAASVKAERDNEFVVRAAGGVRLRTSADVTKGCNINGSGNLRCTGTITADAGVTLTNAVTHVEGDWHLVVAGASAGAIATCPTGTAIIGGGLEADPTHLGTPRVAFAFAHPTGHFAGRVANEHTLFGVRVRARAICLRVAP